MPKRYSAKLKFQIVMELIQGEKTAGQVAKAYGVHPNSASSWRRQFLEKGPKVFAEDNTIQEYTRSVLVIWSSCWGRRSWRLRFHLHCAQAHV